MFGPSNTGSLNSFTGAIRTGIPGPGWSGQVSFTQEASSDPLGRTEHGFSVGGSYDPTGDGIPLTPRLGVTPFFEYTRFENFGGEPNLRRDYLIGGMTFQYGKWQAILAGGLRRNSGSQTGNDHQQNVTVSYALTERLTRAGDVNHINIAAPGSAIAGRLALH